MVVLDLNTLLLLLCVLKSWSLSTRMEPSGSSTGLSSSVAANYPPKRISHDIGKTEETYSTECSWKEQKLLKSEVRSAGRLVGSDFSRVLRGFGRQRRLV